MQAGGTFGIFSWDSGLSLSISTTANGIPMPDIGVNLNPIYHFSKNAPCGL